MLSQINILSSVISRIDSVLADIEGNLIADYQDAELATASQLKKTSLRAAGALAGVVLEGHLQRIAQTHGVKVRKAHPTIADLNAPLKQANIYDTPAWRRIQFLADIRNLCTHKKTREPQEQEIDDLIEGVKLGNKEYLLTAPNKGLQPTPYSVRCAPASRRGRNLAFGCPLDSDVLRVYGMGGPT
jgi:hypothetical protein